ncbi:secretory protein [Chitinophaga agri]|uniref:Secretory protein n=2 Tax=Chitinophaga agri TaxID=2703787 RepID=A0A6B9ZBR7_9BACT|nr:secretory protein [Chitinophaga agri]
MVHSMQGLKRTMGMLCLSLCSLPMLTHAQQAETITRKGYTLEYTNKSPDFDTAVGRRLIETFFTVYPQQAARYNRKTAKKVAFIIDPAYDGVAATSGDVVTFNPAWFRSHPGDIDVVTHEAMHIVQAYPAHAGPWWITEGIADYVRYTMGVDNAGANWSLTPFNEKQHYTNSYRITARFFAWLVKHKNRDIVGKLDSAMRSKKYTDEIWKALTGSTLDDLWKEYAANPVI